MCENGYLGKGWLGDTWFAMALNHHCGAGYWREGGPERWDGLNITMDPFRWGGKELVILGQRGIGENGIAAPHYWAESVQQKLGARIRPHPGNDPPRISLEDDLRDASGVATWSSGAALKALLLGVPVWYMFPKWIGAPAAEFLGGFSKVQANRKDKDRLAMFRRLIWAQWRIEEIASGEAFRWLLTPPSQFVGTREIPRALDVNLPVAD